MNPSAIAKLRRTFIAIAMASFFVVIAVMGTAASVASIAAAVGEANRTIDAIIDANGQTPGEGNFHEGPFHEEASYGLRFFAVTFDSSGNAISVELSHVASISEDAARAAAEVAADPGTITGLGRDGNYIYKEGEVENAAGTGEPGTMVVFLDCSIPMMNARSTIMNTVVVCLGAVIVTFICVFFFSKRAIRSEIENARRQQQFMTNASHELKTPIAVIRANTELTEMMSGETEWTRSTMRQVDRLDGLVRGLMTIVRGEEQGAEANLAETDVSEVVRGAVDSFGSMAQQAELGLAASIAPDVRLRCNPASIEQLTCLLVDNALKYCDPGGNVSVAFSAARIGRGCTLAVSNSYAAGANVDYRRFFDRFYREDESHENQQGYGIGLSAAESICKRYHGSIRATWKAGIITFTCTLKDA